MQIYCKLFQAAADALMESIHKSSSGEMLDGQPISSLQKTAGNYRFKDFLYYKFYPRNFNGTWISDTEILYKDSQGKILHKRDSTIEKQYPL